MAVYIGGGGLKLKEIQNSCFPDSCLEMEAQNITKRGKKQEKKVLYQKATNCHQVILLSLVMLTGILI